MSTRGNIFGKSAPRADFHKMFVEETYSGVFFDKLSPNISKGREGKLLKVILMVTF